LHLLQTLFQSGVRAVTVMRRLLRVEHPMNPPWRRDIGEIIRSTRQAKGLTLAALGRLTGYSVSQVSRFERGISPLTNTQVLRCFAEALALPPQAFGLLPDLGEVAVQPRARSSAKTVTDPGRGPSVVADRFWEDGEDPMRRRDLLTGAAGLAAVGALGLPTPARGARVSDPAADLVDLLHGNLSSTARPVPLPALSASTQQAHALFQAARYEQLAAFLPRLIATATATRNEIDGCDRQTADTLLADAYLVASAFMIKLNDDQLAWTTADRAAQTAAASGDMLTLADAKRSLATVMRRTGRSDQALSFLINTADAISPGRNATAEHLSMYGTLLQVAAYTAAVDGNRGQAADLISAAQATALRLGHDMNHRHMAFGPTNVALYQVSIAQVLGDNGTAITHARTVNPATIPTPERRGRYWVDVARAWHQWGKHEECYKSLLAAEQAAPAEVRFRPPVHRMIRELLHTKRRAPLPGLRDFATRIGVTA
jgi:transcriptional regulator with XRE-family HTH domain